MMKLISTTILIFFGILVAGCASKVKPVTHIVEIKLMEFVPQTINVAAGDSIKWINKDFIEHDIKEEKNGLWKSTKLKTGNSFSIKVGDNSLDYFCTIHPIMKGRINIVKD